MMALNKCQLLSSFSHGPNFFRRYSSVHYTAAVSLSINCVLRKNRAAQQPDLNHSHITCSNFHSTSKNPRQKLSYVHGATNVPLLGTTVGNLLQDAADDQPDRDAMVFYKSGQKLSFSQLLNQSDALAAGLRKFGIKKGDCVGIWGPNTSEWVITQYGTARGGFIMVNINPSYRTQELKYALQKSKCKALIASTGFKDLNYVDMLKEIIPEITITPHGSPLNSEELPDLKYIVMMGPDSHPGSMRFEDLLSSPTPSEVAEIFDLQDTLSMDDPVNIQFTSGTTGSPKGATLTQHNIVNNSYFNGLRCGYHKQHGIICNPVPLYHCFGMIVACMQAVTHKATIVFPSEVFDAEACLRAVETFKCTSLYGVPTMFIDMLNHSILEKIDTSSLITGAIAGSPCPIETMRDIISKMNMHKITVCYGSTETSPVSFQTTGDCQLEKRVSTVGLASEHTEAKVIDSNGNIVPFGQPGELCTRGYSTMLGYWGDEEKTKAAISKQHWYHTGDIAILYEDGYCAITGRIKDMVIRGGENIYPLEIEQSLYEHPKIKDVQVIGVPDKRLGEQVCAWILPKEGETITEQEVKDFCKDRMAKFKIPYYIMFVKDFPKTVTGKVKKNVMREQSAKLLGL